MFFVPSALGRTAALIRGLGREVEGGTGEGTAFPGPEAGKKSLGDSDANNGRFGSPTIKVTGITVDSMTYHTSINLSLMLSDLTCQEQDS